MPDTPECGSIPLVQAATLKELNMPELRRAGKPTLHYALDDYTDSWRHAPDLGAREISQADAHQGESDP